MAATTIEKAPGVCRSTIANVSDLTALQRAVVLTVIYSDLFDYPLTEVELHRYLVLVSADPSELKQALSSVMGSHLEEDGGYIYLAGRGELAERRRRRNARAQQRWEGASRYGRWLVRVPFVRLVSVCGSQAALNPGRKSDLDFFCVTENGRLWIVQVCAMVLRRFASLFSVHVCPNYFLTRDRLAIERRDLYQAREIGQTTPLHGSGAYDEFVAANGWVFELLPNLILEDRRQRLSDIETPRLTRLCERLLGGRLGALLDASIHRILVSYYSLRLRHHGWRKEDVRKAYRRDRQLVMTGGYGGAVRESFLERAREHLGAEPVAEDLERLFPGSSERSRVGPDPLYSRLFRERYGEQRG